MIQAKPARIASLYLGRRGSAPKSMAAARARRVARPWHGWLAILVALFTLQALPGRALAQDAGAPPPADAGAPAPADAGAPPPAQPGQADAGAQPPGPGAQPPPADGGAPPSPDAGVAAPDTPEQAPTLQATETELARGQPVAKVAVAGNRRIATEDVLTYMQQTRVGKAFSPDGLTKDVRELWDSGFFDDVEVDLTRRDDGVHIRLLVRERPSIKAI